jgi:hypothetical protein
MREVTVSIDRGWPWPMVLDALLRGWPTPLMQFDKAFRKSQRT